MAIDSYFLKLREEIEKGILTGLNNRVAMSRLLPIVWLEAQKMERQVLLSVIDVDDFKNINDTYGHDVGDKVLKMVADTLIAGRRKDDITFRLGGEEFIIVFRDISYDQGKIVLERIRQNIENLEIGAEKIKVTVSIGASSLLDDKPKTLDEFIKFADLAMYEAKSQGKNRVILYRDIKDNFCKH